MRPTGSMQSMNASDDHRDKPGAGTSIGTSMSHTGMKQDSAGEPYGLTEARVTETRALRLEVVTYITQMSAELSAMARSSEFALLSYFLDMAAAEARESAAKLSPHMADDASDQPRSHTAGQTLT